MPDILINDTDWNSLSEDMQSEISNIVSSQFPEATIVPDPSGVPATKANAPDADIAEAAGIPLATGAVQSCIDDCNSARDIALPLCGAMGSPSAIAVCLVVVQVAAALCRANCPRT
jgi:hypothetical protein